jgi:hypothetical protein
MDARKLNRASLAGFAVVAFLALAGCRFAWNLWARGDLARDVKIVLARQGILVKDVKCRMFGTLNSGACFLPMTAEQAKLVVQGLRLRVLAPTEDIREFRGGCSQTPPFDTGFVRMYRTSAMRPPELKLRESGGFDYLYLYHHPTSAAACIQVLYTPEGVKLLGSTMER